MAEVFKVMDRRKGAWSDKVATKRVPDPICPRCEGPCAGASNGVWCVVCGTRAYG